MRVARTLVWLIASGCWPGAFKVGEGFDGHKHPGVDQCPDKAEDYDGYRDSDGCPDPDNDDDGIPDVDDACPNEAGDLVAPSARGCPSR